MRLNTREWRERSLSTEDRILLCAASTQVESAWCAVMAALLAQAVDLAYADQTCGMARDGAAPVCPQSAAA